MSKLVYDVGMHEGEDSEFYLSRGCRVVGIEANPELVKKLEKRFAAEIERGQLTIVGKAIAERPGKVRFAIDRSASTWGTISESFLVRNRSQGNKVDFVEVEAVTFDDVLREHGIPYYIKIDIEGMDLLCIEALHRMTERPRFISIESAVTSGVSEVESGFAELAHLWTLGYRRFKYVDQTSLVRMNGKLLAKEGPPLRYSYREHSSGPFGEEITGEWHAIDEALDAMRRLVWYQNLHGLGGRYSQNPVSKAVRRLQSCWKKPPYHHWYDLHARVD